VRATVYLAVYCSQVIDAQWVERPLEHRLEQSPPAEYAVWLAESDARALWEWPEKFQLQTGADGVAGQVIVRGA